MSVVVSPADRCRPIFRPPFLRHSTVLSIITMDQVFAFDAISYFLQAFAGEVLLIFPIVYGFTNSAPFNTWNIEFALYFFPFIITGVLPTVAALGWQKTSSERVSEDQPNTKKLCTKDEVTKQGSGHGGSSSHDFPGREKGFRSDLHAGGQSREFHAFAA